MYNCRRLTAFDFIKDVCRTLRHKLEILQYVGGVVEETDISDTGQHGKSVMVARSIITRLQEHTAVEKSAVVLGMTLRRLEECKTLLSGLLF